MLKYFFDKWHEKAQLHLKDTWKSYTVCTNTSYLPNQKEGKRWLEQAESDLKALQILNACSRVPAYSDVCCHVCFMAHQVAEKVLKAGRYAVCGMSDDHLVSHNLTPHAYAIQEERSELANDLSSLSSSLEKYYLDTRFPNRHTYPDVPANLYKEKEASEACDKAEKIMEIIRKLLH